MPVRVIQIFLCPYCNKYTVHMPRITHDGRVMVDHFVKLERLFFDVAVEVPYNYCEITLAELTLQDLFTRTVIRV